MFNSFSLFVSKYFLFIYCFLENVFKLKILYEDQLLLAPFDRILYTLFNDAKDYNSHFSSRKNRDRDTDRWSSRDRDRDRHHRRDESGSDRHSKSRHGYQVKQISCYNFVCKFASY